jgi:hypothetical protein
MDSLEGVVPTGGSIAVTPLYGTTIASVTVKAYSDAACTVPVTLSGASVEGGAVKGTGDNWNFDFYLPSSAGLVYFKAVITDSAGNSYETTATPTTVGTNANPPVTLTPTAVYTITSYSSGDNTITPSKTSAVAGELITLTVSGADAAKFRSMTLVFGGEDTPLVYSPSGVLQYAFTMPSGDVSVKAAVFDTGGGPPSGDSVTVALSAGAIPLLYVSPHLVTVKGYAYFEIIVENDGLLDLSGAIWTAYLTDSRGIKSNLSVEFDAKNWDEGEKTMPYSARVYQPYPYVDTLYTCTLAVDIDGKVFSGSFPLLVIYWEMGS